MLFTDVQGPSSRREKETGQRQNRKISVVVLISQFLNEPPLFYIELYYIHFFELPPTAYQVTHGCDAIAFHRGRMRGPSKNARQSNSVKYPLVNPNHSSCLLASWALKCPSVLGAFTFCVVYADERSASKLSGSFTYLPHHHFLF